MVQNLNLDSDTNDEHEKLREQILEASINIIREDGTDGLSLRKVADASGTSTQMIYTLFGGKQNLIASIYEEGSERLLQRFESVPEDQPPLIRLYKMGLVYRDFALEYQSLYEEIFSSGIPDQTIVKKTHVHDKLNEAVEACFDEGLLTNQDPQVITEAFWAAAHGAISLELSGYYESEEAAKNAYDHVLGAIYDGFRVENPTPVSDESG